MSKMVHAQWGSGVRHFPKFFQSFPRVEVCKHFVFYMGNRYSRWLVQFHYEMLRKSGNFWSSTKPWVCLRASIRYSASVIIQLVLVDSWPKTVKRELQNEFESSYFFLANNAISLQSPSTLPSLGLSLGRCLPTTDCGHLIPLRHNCVFTFLSRPIFKIIIWPQREFLPMASATRWE